MPGKLPISIFLFPVILLIVYSLIVINAGKWLVRDYGNIHADAMVILMGSIADRVLQAEYVYMEGMTDEIIIVEESMGAYKALNNKGVQITSTTKQVHDALVTLGIPADSIIILPGDAVSTKMEAMIVRDYCTGRSDIDTLLLVSSAHHTRRASIIFRYTFRKSELPVTILSSPSQYTGFNPDKWWKNKEDIQKVSREYLKIATFLLFEKREL